VERRVFQRFPTKAVDRLRLQVYNGVDFLIYGSANLWFGSAKKKTRVPVCGIAGGEVPASIIGIVFTQ